MPTSTNGKKNHYPKDTVIQTLTLHNGLHLIYQSPTTNTQVTSIRAYCMVGSIYENEPSLRGASHFIEHMCFKGTKSLATAKEIFGAHDRMGAYLNAYTEKTYTCYEVDCLSMFVRNCLEIVSDMMLRSTFPQKEYAKEYRVVMEETEKNLADYLSISYEQMEFMLFRDTPYAYPVDHACYHRRHRIIPRDTLFTFYKEHYVPDNMVVSIVSYIPFATIVEYVKESYFGKPCARKATARIPPTIHSGRTCAHFTEKTASQRVYAQWMDGISTSYLSVGIRTCDHFSPDYETLEWIRYLVDGGSSSRLFTLLREDNGLSYLSHAKCRHNAMGGLFCISVVTDTTHLMKHGSLKKGVYELVIGLLDDLAKKGFSETEYADAKDGILNHMRMNAESGENMAENNGMELIDYTFRDPLSYASKYRRYEKITLKQINDCARRYFSPENRYVSLVGGGSMFPSIVKRLQQIYR